MEKRKTLLERYNIPLNHLDFGYIEQCQNAREMEKILQILRSEEEGYYPDLTKCAEQKLKELKPGSKLFRYEEPLLKRDALGVEELKPIYDWSNEIKQKDERLTKIREEAGDSLGELPPMRKCGKIVPEKQNEGDDKQEQCDAEEKKGVNTTKSSEKRIKATDYREWDKYDPDVELLRMDLEDERAKEEVERKNRLNTRKCTESVKITELNAEETAAERQRALVQKLSQVEREKYAEERRLYGNECYRAKEYENAIKEYTRAINFGPSNAARAYNNRAIANMKLKQYSLAIEDCEQCLKLEPNNIKALTRLADANMSCGRRLEAYQVYLKVLSLEPSNAIAVRVIDELRAEFGEFAPANATRLQIREITTNNDKNVSVKQETKKSTKASKDKKPPSAKAMPKDYDLAELVKPNCVVKSQLANAAEMLGSIKNAGKPTKTQPPQQQQQQQEMARKQMILPPQAHMPPEVEQLLLPMKANVAKPASKILIEEI